MIFTYLRMRLITAAFCMYLLNQECRGQEHLGCYADNRTDRLLPTLAKVSNSNTVDICIDTCKNIGETYAGVVYGEECWCGDSHGFSRNGVAVAPDMMKRWCNFECKGNKSQLCGGIDHINVYSVCPRGRYHDPEGGVGNCDSECYCNASHICLYSTGQCPDGCQDGWYGGSCFLNAPPPTPYSRSTSTAEVLSIDAISPLETNSPAITTTDGATPVAGIVAGTTVTLRAILVILGLVIVHIYRHRSKQGRTSSHIQPRGRMESTTEGVDGSFPLAHRNDTCADKYDTKATSGATGDDTGDTNDAAYYNAKAFKTAGGTEVYANSQPKERLGDATSSAGVYEEPHSYMNTATEPTYTPLNKPADYQNIQ